MSMPSGMELLIIVLIVLILFGGKKIPELAKGLGSGIRNFKKAVKEDEEVATASTDSTASTASTASKIEDIEKKAEVPTEQNQEIKKS